MKVLTVRWPWAILIVKRFKDVENRSWVNHHRGPVLIHLGSWWVEREALSLYRRVGKLEPNCLHSLGRFESWTGRRTAGGRVVGCKLHTALGAIIGQVDLVDIAPSTSKWAEPGQKHWQLANPVEFREPIACKGKQGLFNLPVELEEKVRTQLEMSR